MCRSLRYPVAYVAAISWPLADRGQKGRNLHKQIVLRLYGRGRLLVRMNRRLCHESDCTAVGFGHAQAQSMPLTLPRGHISCCRYPFVPNGVDVCPNVDIVDGPCQSSHECEQPLNAGNIRWSWEFSKH